MPSVRAGLHDLNDLGGREAELLVRVVVVRPEPDARVGAKVAEDLPLGELPVDGLELGRTHRHSPAAAGRVTGAADVEAGTVEQVDQELRLAQRVLTNTVDPDLLD